MSVESRISRKTLSIMTLVVTLFIVVLYNLPGSRKPGDVESGPLVMPDPITTTSQEASKSALTSLDLIEKTQQKAHRVHIESWNTPKGAKVMFVRAPEIPMLDVRVIWDAGSARDGNLPGLAKLTNAMLTEGAGIADVDAIARHFEGLGANLDTGSYRDMALVSLRSLSDPTYREPALSMFYDVIAHPTFPETSLERLRAQMLLSLQHEKQSPESLGQKAFFQTLYEGQPYGIHPSGTEQSLALLSSQSLRDFHQQYYVASNMVVAIIGAIERSDAELIALQLDKQLPQGETAAPFPAPQAPQAAEQQHIEYPSSQTHITVGTQGVKRGDPDWYPLYVGNEILGAGGFSSRLNQIIRQDNGLAYSVYSHFIPMAAPGPFMVGLQTRNDQSQQALALLNQTLKNFVKEGPTGQELEDAKRHLLGSFPLQTDSNGNIVSYLGMIGFYNLPLNFLESFPSQVEAVTANAIKKAFAKRINTDALLTITVGQAAKPDQP